MYLYSGTTHTERLSTYQSSMFTHQSLLSTAFLRSHSSASALHVWEQHLIEHDAILRYQ